LRIGLQPRAFQCHGGQATSRGRVTCHRLVRKTYRLSRMQQVWLDGVLLVGKEFIGGLGLAESQAPGTANLERHKVGENKMLTGNMGEVEMSPVPHCTKQKVM
jgi:hypothetical protein